MARPRTALVGILVALALAVSACGSSAGSSGATADRRGIPDVTVTEVVTGQPVTLASVTRADLPTLVWFWAPH